MPVLIDAPTQIDAAGTPPKRIAEYVGRASTHDTELSIAYMRSPAGWTEPPQAPAFDEYTLVLTGTMTVEHGDDVIDVHAGSAVFVPAGEEVRYATPDAAEYVSICRPAFSPDLVHRDDG